MNETVHSSASRGFRLCWGYCWSATKLVLRTLALLLATLPPVFATDDSYPNQQFVRYDKDNVSIAFTNLRASEATYLMRTTTGIAINLPSSMQSKTINLTLHGAKLDQAVRSLLSALELNSFLIYDHGGRLTGVIVLEKAAIQPSSQESEEDKKKTSYRELAVNELESILRDFGRWSELSAEEQKAIHARLKTIPPSRVRDQVIKEYLRQVLQVAEQSSAAAEEDPKSTTQARLSSQ